VIGTERRPASPAAQPGQVAHPWGDRSVWAERTRDVDDRSRRGGPATGPAWTLGALSASLGIAALTQPRPLAEAMGLKPDAATTSALRAVGVRELVAAGGLLMRRHPERWLWARVGGDLIDLALLASGARTRGARAPRIPVAGAVLATVTAVDLLAALRVRRSNGVTGGDRVIRARAAVTVNRPVHEVYEFWHDLENLPRFMIHLESVRVTGPGGSHWTATAPAGRTVEWDATVTADRRDELIAWESDPGARVRNRGAVRFMPAPGDRGTVISVELEYEPPGGALGSLVARLLGEEPVQQVKDDLRRCKQLLETGEIARSAASPEGTRAARQLLQRPAQYAGTKEG
jgi:uncharacterized membrane protein